MEEIWRDVAGFEGMYQVSNLGRFKNRHRILSGIKSRGYFYFNLGGRGGVRRGLHVIVAQAFPEICGEWFEGASVHHKDFDRSNNNADNLIVLTHSEHNHIHYKYLPDSFTKASEKRSKAISKALKGKRAPYKHIPIVQLSKDGTLVKEWECISDVLEAGYLPGNVCACCRGKLKTAYGFLWRYAVNN